MKNIAPRLIVGAGFAMILVGSPQIIYQTRPYFRLIKKIIQYSVHLTRLQAAVIDKPNYIKKLLAIHSQMV